MELNEQSPTNYNAPHFLVSFFLKIRYAAFGKKRLSLSPSQA